MYRIFALFLVKLAWKVAVLNNGNYIVIINITKYNYKFCSSWTFQYHKKILYMEVVGQACSYFERTKFDKRTHWPDFHKQAPTHLHQSPKYTLMNHPKYRFTCKPQDSVINYINTSRHDHKQALLLKVYLGIKIYWADHAVCHDHYHF